MTTIMAAKLPIVLSINTLELYTLWVETATEKHPFLFYSLIEKLSTLFVAFSLTVD